MYFISHSKMPFLCRANKNHSFVTAIKKSDLNFIKSNLKLQYNQETRDSDIDEEIFYGFYPIHYAAVCGSEEIIDLLVARTGSVLTGSDATVHSKHLQNYFQIPAGQDVVSLLIIK